MSANVAPMTMNSTPPQKFLSWPIFMSMSRSRSGESGSCEGPIMSDSRRCAHGAAQQRRLTDCLLRQPEQLCRREVRLLPLGDERRHLVVGDVDQLEPLVGHR